MPFTQFLNRARPVAQVLNRQDSTHHQAAVQRSLDANLNGGYRKLLRWRRLAQRRPRERTKFGPQHHKPLLTMQLEELIILLPCHSLEDFPLYLEADDADDLLATWSAPWHPSLLAAARGTPKWHRADEPPQQLAGRLIFIPKASEPLIPAGFRERAKNEGGAVVCDLTDREAMVRSAIQQALDSPSRVDDALAADFLALGFSYLLVELLTRQMR